VLVTVAVSRGFRAAMSASVDHFARALDFAEEGQMRGALVVLKRVGVYFEQGELVRLTLREKASLFPKIQFGKVIRYDGDIHVAPLVGLAIDV
jgi:hypothetical protein